VKGKCKREAGRGKQEEGSRKGRGRVQGTSFKAQGTDKKTRWKQEEGSGKRLIARRYTCAIY
jgi:hypothetical protein